MARNVGRYDRILRLTGGLLLVVAGWAALSGVLVEPLDVAGTAATVLAVVVGVVLLVTGLLGWCPVHYGVGIDTRRREVGRSDG